MNFLAFNTVLELALFRKTGENRDTYVVQPLPRLATNRSGRLEYAVAGAVPVLEFTVTEAHDI